MGKAKYRKKTRGAVTGASHRRSEPQLMPLRRMPSEAWQIDAVIFLLMMMATVALYAGVFGAGFLDLDDPQYVTDNPWIRSFRLENLRHILGAPYSGNYSPMHLLSYMLDYAIAGPNAFAFHLSSSISAGLAAGFVFLVALALTGKRIVSLAASLLFIVHPVHVEAIAWIASRKDLVA